MLDNYVNNNKDHPGLFYINRDDSLRDSILMDGSDIVAICSEYYSVRGIRVSKLNRLLSEEFIDPTRHVGSGVNTMDIVALLREFHEITVSAIAYDHSSRHYGIILNAIEYTYKPTDPEERINKIIENMESFEGKDAILQKDEHYVSVSWALNSR